MAKTPKNNNLVNIILCGLCVAAITVFAILIIKPSGKQAQNESSGSVVIDESTGEPIESEEESDDGSIEYNFIDTTSMTEEEISALESRIREEQEYSYEPVLPVDQDGHYVNSEISCTFANGAVLHIGIGSSVTQNGMYLNPRYEWTDDEIFMTDEYTAIGFYFYTDGNDFKLSSSETFYYEAKQPPEEHYYYISDRTYDTLIPSTYKDIDGFGLMWYDKGNFNGWAGDDRTIFIRIIRLPDGMLLNTARLEISWDWDNFLYTYSALYDSDVTATGQMTEAEKTALLDTAFDFLTDTAKGGQSANMDPEKWPFYRDDFGNVQQVDFPYFSVLFDGKGQIVTSGHYWKGITAVNVSYPGWGVLTVYFQGGQPVGFDAMSPFTKTTLFVPSFLEGREKFFE